MVTRHDLFSFYSYRPFVCFTLESINPQKIHWNIHSFIFVEILLQMAISVDSEFHNNDIEDTNVAYVYISDAYHNKFRVVAYAKDFCSTIVEYYGVKFIPVTILPPEKRIRIFIKDGNPIEIKKVCTALVFTFAPKTDIGVYYNGAEVNGKSVEMDLVFQPSDQIAIIKSDEPTVRIDWFKILETKHAVLKSEE